MKKEISCEFGKIYKRKAERMARLKEVLDLLYPDALCALEYEGDPFRLLVMARLSAQCTDKRVNIVSEKLFERFPDAKAMSEAPLGELEELIRSCGLFHTKAKNLRDASRIIASDFSGKVPSGMDELLSLPGVGRKIANLIRGDIYSLGGIVADTHCIRIANRLGFTSRATPPETEKSLEKLIARENQSAFCHKIVLFGREYCTAQSPKCKSCPLMKGIK